MVLNAEELVLGAMRVARGNTAIGEWARHVVISLCMVSDENKAVKRNARRIVVWALGSVIVEEVFERNRS